MNPYEPPRDDIRERKPPPKVSVAGRAILACWVAVVMVAGPTVSLAMTPAGIAAVTVLILLATLIVVWLAKRV